MEGGRVNFIPILRRNFIEHPGIHLHKLLAQFKIGNNITEITKQKLLDFKIETKKKMKKCKITVMRKACYKDLMEKVFEEYRKCGIRDLELKLYEDDRHEILNELDRENVYLDVKNWILKHI